MALPIYIVTSSAPVSDVADATVLAGTGGAALIGIADSGDKYTGTTVEAALTEIGAGTTLDGRYVKVDQTSPQTLTGQFQLPSARIGDVTNNSQFAADGTLTMNGTATVWDDLRIEPVARTTGANAPTFEKWYDDTAGTSRGVYLYSFDDAAAGSEKEVHFTMQMPHAWALTSIYMHVHWVGNNADTTAAPRWGLEYIWQKIGGGFGDTTIVYSDGSNYTGSGTDADIIANKHYISKFAAISPGTSANAISSILIGRLFRNSSDAADTYDVGGNKCGLLYIDAHYEVNTLGSNTEYTK